MKSRRWWTSTGRKPALAAPAARALSPASAIGVSNTRLLPKRSTSPCVVPKIPAGVSAPIPQTKTPGSSSSAWRRAALMDCAKLSCVLWPTSCELFTSGDSMSEGPRQRFGLATSEARYVATLELDDARILAGPVHVDDIGEIDPSGSLGRGDGRMNL